MRVTCKSVADFLTNLSLVESDHVHLRTVYVDDGERRPNELRVDRTIQASAVINDDSGGQYLLVVGEACGIDRLDSKEMDGTQRLSSLRERLDDFCGERGLHVRPGIVSE